MGWTNSRLVYPNSSKRQCRLRQRAAQPERLRWGSLWQWRPRGRNNQGKARQSDQCYPDSDAQYVVSSHPATSLMKCSTVDRSQCSNVGRIALIMWDVQLTRQNTLRAALWVGAGCIGLSETGLARYKAFHSLNASRIETYRVRLSMSDTPQCQVMEDCMADVEVCTRAVASARTGSLVFPAFTVVWWSIDVDRI